MLSDPKVVKLFELLLDKRSAGFEPVFKPRRNGWVSYPAVEAELGIGPEHAEQLLDDLHRLGYLTRSFHDKILFCPACNSPDLKLVSLCPRCHSAHVAHERVFEHRNCGYVGPEADYLKGNARICPKCRVELVLVGSDYTIHARRQRCLECEAAVDAPEERWTCRNCGASHARDEVREQLLCRYGLDEAQVAKLRVERIPKARVREFLTREGYELQEGIQATGRSGAEHRLDLVAMKRSGPLEHKIVVGFANAAHEVDSEEVIKLYAKAYDVSAQDIIMVASPKLSEDARQFASHYHIKVYNADELDRTDVQLAF